MDYAPPTIAQLKADGVARVRVTCLELACRHSGTVPFEAVGLPDDTLFPRIKAARRFACSKCSSREVSLMPDWPARGAGGL